MATGNGCGLDGVGIAFLIRCCEEWVKDKPYSLFQESPNITFHFTFGCNVHHFPMALPQLELMHYKLTVNRRIGHPTCAIFPLLFLCVWRRRRRIIWVPKWAITFANCYEVEPFKSRRRRRYSVQKRIRYLKPGKKGASAAIGLKSGLNDDG